MLDYVELVTSLLQFPTAFDYLKIAATTGGSNLLHQPKRLETNTLQ